MSSFAAAPFDDADASFSYEEWCHKLGADYDASTETDAVALQCEVAVSHEEAVSPRYACGSTSVARGGAAWCSDGVAPSMSEPPLALAYASSLPPEGLAPPAAPSAASASVVPPPRVPLSMPPSVTSSVPLSVPPPVSVPPPMPPPLPPVEDSACATPGDDVRQPPVGGEAEEARVVVVRLEHELKAERAARHTQARELASLHRQLEFASAALSRVQAAHAKLEAQASGALASAQAQSAELREGAARGARDGALIRSLQQREANLLGQVTTLLRERDAASAAASAQKADADALRADFGGAQQSQVQSLIA